MAHETRETSQDGTASGTSGPILAGTAAPDAGARITGTRHHQDHSGPGPGIMAASSLEGETVVDAQGENLGEIEEIMLDVRGGRIAYAVMSVGGFLGVGEKYFAVPWHSFTMDTDNKRFILDVDKERLLKAPGFDQNEWPSMADKRWASEIHDYYGARPYWEK